MTRCPQHQRHWFTYYGRVGMASPVCVRCGAPNPRHIPDEEINSSRSSDDAGEPKKFKQSLKIIQAYQKEK